MSSNKMHLLHLSDSRSMRCTWAIEELGLGDRVEIHRFKRIDGKRAPDMTSALKLDVEIPNKVRSRCSIADLQAPALVDGDLVVLESANILQYLSEKYDDKLLPPLGQWAERSLVLQWLSFAESTLMLHTMPIVYARWTFEEGDGAERITKTMQGNVDNDLRFVDQQLASTKAFIAGSNLSIADIQLAWTCIYLVNKKVGVESYDKYPNIDRWLKEIVQRPAYKKAASDGLHSFTY